MKYFIGTLYGFVSCLIVFIIANGRGVDLCTTHNEHNQLEYDAYRHCMQVAGQMKCSMTPKDFVRYYELKHQLEIENE